MNEEQLHKARHSIAHLMAGAIQELYPDAKNTIGPAIDNGFYYDYDFATPISDKDLNKIENKMRELSKKWDTFEQKFVTPAEAREMFKDNPYKLELIDGIEKDGQQVSIYTSGSFFDLCSGPHVANMKEIDLGGFKLLKLAGAYWRGDEKNKMLTRIYGLAFENKAKLEEYLTQLSEAEKRDHRKLGKEMGLFIFSDLIGPGLPIYTFKGNAIRKEIMKYSNELQSAIGFQEVHTPNMNKAELFKVSGHYEKYKEDMMKVVSNYSKEEYFLKPMNCPQHTQVYAAEKRSYRDLPIRIADFANLYRDERPGELNGLTRLRCFCQDDGHAFCREDQIKQEFNNVLSAVNKALTTYKMSYVVRLSLWDSTKPEKYLGDKEVWEKAQKLLEEILIESKVEYVVGVGEAAIYGPKMDFISTDALGRKWQISTIQLDLIMPVRFGLTYTDSDGKEKTPIMIHRALIGSPERFMGILIEHYAGNFPVWLSPMQVKIIPVRENHNEFAKKISDQLKSLDVRVDFDDRDEGMGKKIRAGKNERVPYMIVIGDKEMAENILTIESRDTGAQEKMSTEQFVEKITKEIKYRV
ncbi:MAG: threonine--tRNA ligase [bacterium]